MPSSFKFLLDKSYEPKQVKFSVVPSDATITYSIDDSETVTYDKKYLLIDNGKTLKYTVSKTGYQSLTTEEIITEDKTISVSLVKFKVVTFNVNPSDSTVKYKINDGEQKTLEGNFIYVSGGDNVSYEVSRDNYITQTGSLTNVQEDTTVEVSLVKICKVTFDITPSDATITYSINDGETQTLSGNVLTAKDGDLIRYTISKTGYISNSGAIPSLSKDETITIALVKQHTITFNVTPSDATIKYAINSGSTQTLVGNTLVVTDGDVVAYSFEKEGYETYNSSLTVHNNETITYTMKEDGITIYDSNNVAHKDTKVVDDGSYTFYNANLFNSDVTGDLNFNSLSSITTQNFFNNSFYECLGITSVSFPSLTSIGGGGLEYAFEYCTGITSVSFPNLTTIDNYGLYYAFEDCTGITSVSFPNLTTIGYYGLYYAFEDCTGITSVSFPNLTSIGNSGLYYAFEDCTGITSVSFPSLTSIGGGGLESAFYNCTSITGSISFPNLTTIDNYGLYYAFEDCTGITSVSFPNLTSIGNYGLKGAFYNCTSITGSISFPNLTTIGNSGLYYAFEDCTGITSVHFKKSMSGNSQCTASNMGCTNATVYFDLP